jgi:uncharacterized membrane protein HdeD (DUF308 family)
MERKKGELFMMKQIKWTNVLMSLAYAVAGVLLVIFPNESGNVISYIVGGAAIVCGIVALTAYFLADLKDTLYNNYFVIGLLSIIFGLAIVVKKELILDLIPFVLGLLIVTSGLTKLHRAVIASRIKYDAYLTYALLGVVSIILGIVVMFFMSGKSAQSIIFTVIGCGMIYSGLSDLFIQFFLANKFNAFIKAFKGETDNVVDVDAIEQTTVSEQPEETEQQEESSEPTDPTNEQ